MDGGDQKTVKPSRGRPQESCPSCNQPLISALCLPSDVYLACSGPRNSHPTQNEGHCDPPALHRSRAFSTTSRRSSIERLLGAARRRAPSSSDAAAAAGSSLLSPSSVCLSLDCTFSSVQFALGSSVSASLSLCRVSFVWLLLPLTLLWGKWHFLLVLLSAFFCSSARPSSVEATKATEAAGAGEEAATAAAVGGWVGV